MKNNKDAQIISIEDKINVICEVIYEFNMTIQTEIEEIVKDIKNLKNEIENEKLNET